MTTSTLISIVTAFLRLATSLISWLRDRKMFKAGEDHAVYLAALELLETTTKGKEIRQRVAALEPGEEADLWNEMLKK